MPNCVGCGATAAWFAETPLGEVPLCQSCYDDMIASAQKRTPGMSPELVRSCMERASYPVSERKESDDA